MAQPKKDSRSNLWYGEQRIGRCLGIEKNEGLPHSEIINVLLCKNAIYSSTDNGQWWSGTDFEKVRLSGASSVCSKLHCSTRLRGQGSGMSSGWRDGKRRRIQTLVNPLCPRRVFSTRVFLGVHVLPSGFLMCTSMKRKIHP
jgi:hypothetical protein